MARLHMPLLILCSLLMLVAPASADRDGRGHDDDDLRDIGGDQLLPEGVGAIEQRTARCDIFDHPLPVAAALDADYIAAGQFAFLAAREAQQHFSRREFDQVLPSMRRDDGAFVLQADAACPASRRRAVTKASSADTLSFSTAEWAVVGWPL